MSAEVKALRDALDEVQNPFGRPSRAQERLVLEAAESWVDALSTPPASDVREALPSSDGALTSDQVMQHAYANAVTRAPGRMAWGEALRHFEMWMREHDARLIAEVRPRGTVTDAEVERSCEIMHDAYEAAAAVEGWSTQEASRKPWDGVPEANKRTMRIAVRALLEARS